MRIFIYTFAFTALFSFVSVPSIAQGVGYAPASNQTMHSFSRSESNEWSLDRDQGLTYQMTGDREEGALRFYLRADKRDMEDPALADSLNRIAPATGIQFHMEF